MFGRTLVRSCAGPFPIMSHSQDVPRRPALFYPLVLLAATLLILFFYGEIPYASQPYVTTDLYHYRQMAAAAPGLPVDVQQPYLYRLLGPYLAGLLPLPDVAAFRLLTWLAAMALAQLFFAYLRSSGIRSQMALLAVLFFLLNKHLFGVHVWSFFQLADLFAFIALLLLLWALEQRRWRLFGLVFLFAALSKETPLLMAPAAVVYLWQQGRAGVLPAWRSQLVRLLAALTPGLIAFLALRLLLEPAGGLGLAAAALRYAAKFTAPATWFRLFANPFLPFLLLPLLFWRQTLAFLQARWHLLLFLALIAASTLFGSNNERLMAPAFLVFYPLLAQIMQTRLAGRPALLLTLLLCAVAASLHHEIARFPLPDRAFSLALSLGALVVVTAVALPLALPPARSPSRPPAPPQF